MNYYDDLSIEELEELQQRAETQILYADEIIRKTEQVVFIRQGFITSLLQIKKALKNKENELLEVRVVSEQLTTNLSL